MWLPLTLFASETALAAPLSPVAWSLANPAPVSHLDSLIWQGRDQFDRGQVLRAAETLNRAAELARQTSHPHQQSSALLTLSACRIRLFDYRGAQQAAEESRRLALKTGDKGVAGAAAVNLASIYLQLGDYPFAGKEAASAFDLLKGTPRKGHLVKALLIYANAEAERTRNKVEIERANGDAEGERRDIEQLKLNYRQGVDIAHAYGLPSLEAALWEELGYSLLLARLPDQAEEPLHRAYLLESANHDDALADNQAHWAELQLQRKNYSSALDLIDHAFASGSASFKTIPRFYSLHTRGLALAGLGREDEALAELLRAVNAADEWRQGALPGDATSTQTVVVLHDVYDDYAQLAAGLSIARHNPELARHGLEVLAENRAASLREQIALSLSRKHGLPIRYFDLLTELQSAQARVTLGENRPEDKVKLKQVRLEIGDVENDFGLRPQEFSSTHEKNVHRNSLRDVQSRVSKDEALLSFSVGRESSFLWAVTQTQVSVHRIAGENELTNLSRRFSQAVQRRQSVAEPARQLSQELFAGLPPSVWQKREWLIVGDGILLGGVPFASLVDLSSASRTEFLNESRDLRFIPSEFLLLSSDKVGAEQNFQRRFLGIGDPIYNSADGRGTKATEGENGGHRAAMALARLAGSDQEVRTAAQQSGMTSSEILTGPQATVAGLQKAIAANRPEILHFAVHVANPDPSHGIDQSSQAALALSLTKDDMPELLTPEAIVTMRVPGSLVILSGCSSQRGELLPSAGVMGLSRAWLIAGASAVIVSAWPTPDDSGPFFSAFYGYFDAASSGPIARRAAYALQRAQVEMGRSQGYRSAPKFWAAYSVISKE